MSDSNSSVQGRIAIGTASGGAIASFLAMNLDAPVAEAAAIILLCPILLSIALWNGFPLIFYDTGAYVYEGLGHVFIAERPPVYSEFLRFTGAAWSFWLVVLCQSLMTAFTMTEFTRAVAPRVSLGMLLGIGAALSLVTGIAWYVGQIEPDCLTAVAVLALYLLAFRASTLGTARIVALTVTATIAIASHTSHLGVAAGLVLCIAFLRLAPYLWRRSRQLPVPNVVLPFVSFVFAIVLVLASNYDFTGQIFLSRSGPVFVFARLLQDGIVKRLLDDTCPGSHYKVCKYKEQLPPHADAWLWDKTSPFNKLGRFNGTMLESQRIVSDSLTRYPAMQIESAIADTGLQLVLFRTGDGIEPQEWAIYSSLDRFVPRQMYAYMHARQQRGLIRFVFLNVVHESVGLLSLICLIFMFRSALLRRDWDGLTIAGFVLIALLGNAFVCAVLSNPHDRYQSRLIWVPAFVIALAAGQSGALSLRRPVESVT